MVVVVLLVDPAVVNSSVSTGTTVIMMMLHQMTLESHIKSQDKQLNCAKLPRIINTRMIASVFYLLWQRGPHRMLCLEASL